MYLLAAHSPVTPVTSVIIVLLGIAIVVVAILVVKLHPCIALLLAALTVATLTPYSALEQYANNQVQNSKVQWNQKDVDKYLATTPAGRVATEFGTMCGKIGIIIAMASIIGTCLLDSGAADKIVRTILRWLGPKRVGISFVGSGFLLAIPVFFDTVFYLMIPLGKAMRLRTGGNYILYILAIVAGGSMAHSLVPPTPGPLVVAELLDGVSILDMIIGGCVVGSFTATLGYLFATWVNKRIEIPLRHSPDAQIDDLQKQADVDESLLPSFFMSVLPILLPVILIALATATDTYTKSLTSEKDEIVQALNPNTKDHQKFVLEKHANPKDYIRKLDEKLARLGKISPTIKAVGDKNFALVLAAGLAMMMFMMRQENKKKRITIIQNALASAGIIVLITAAGGGFGAVIKQSGIVEIIKQIGNNYNGIVVLLVAFTTTTAIRTAQGSATVAMITAAGIFTSLSNPNALGFHPVYLALAIGCGSKPVAWMADSGFWVICKMSGMTEAEALKTLTPMSIVMGIAGITVTLLFAMLFPML